MALRKFCDFEHLLRGGFDKDILLDPVEGKGHQRRTPMSWYDDIKMSTGMAVTEAVKATTERDEGK